MARGRFVKLKSVRTVVTALASFALSSTLLTPVAAAAARPDLWSPFPLAKAHSVDVTDVGGSASSSAAKPVMKAFHASHVSWPKAATAKVTLNAAPVAPLTSPLAAAEAQPFTTSHAPVQAAGTPVTIGASGVLDSGLLPRRSDVKSALSKGAHAAAPGTVHVTVASHKTAQDAGINGVIVSLTRADARQAEPAHASIALDYSSFAEAYGGDYASRLRLVSLPACSVTTPEKAACQTRTPVTAAANDVESKRLVADVALPAADTGTAGQPVVLAASAAPAGTAGTYSATSLAPSGKWGTSGNTGAFTYSYPLTVPPSVGGDAPSVSFDYNSASIDGRTSATNNQASWVGDGWSYNTGSIERAYRPCSDDGQTKDGDECWAGDNATLSLGSSSGTLVPAGSGKWRIANDDGALVEELSGADNGLNGGTYWRLTKDDGTQYYFGADHLPSAAGGNGSDASTNSAWGVPVYGNDTGEPCHASTFDKSECTQGWRWNLDFTVDPNKNITVYHYAAERNYYGRGSTHTLTSYTRGGYPTLIAYGQQVKDYVAKATPAAEISFAVAQRCDGKSGVDCTKAPTSATASHWPDVPYDLNCGSSGTCDNYSPSFWSTMRLKSVTTKVWDESLATPAWSTVDTYSLSQSYPDPGDGTKPAMWLSSVQRTGADTRGGGSKTTTPAVKFSGQAGLPNRVDGLEQPENIPPLNRYRLQSITTESGETITVTYDSSHTCSRTAPPKEDADTSTCYPVRWSPPGYPDPILDWFYTYPVTEVDENDIAASGSPSIVTTYEYKDGTAWHHDDNPITAKKDRTWGDFRGYSEVITRTGKSPDPVTKTVTDYLRGMNGDATSTAGTTKSVKVTDLTGTSITDDDALSGFVYQTTVYDKDGGKPQSESVSHPWLSAPTATKDEGDGLPDLVARHSGIGEAIKRDLKKDGSWRTTETDTTYDAGTGLPVRVDDKGEVGSDGKPVAGSTTPEQCTTTHYASDADRNMTNFPSEVISEAGACVNAPDAHTTADTKTWYDKSTTLGAIPGPGNATSTQSAKSVSSDGTLTWAAADSTSYDAYGRVTATSDPLGRKTSTSYGSTATAQKYLPVTKVTKNAKGWPTTTTFDPGRQAALTTLDMNQRLTTETYDGLGRLTAVWLPGHAKSSNPNQPNDKFTYTLSSTAPSVVESQQLLDSGDYSVDYQIYDALLRSRQEQSTPKDGSTGRLIADTAYDSHGWTTETDAPFYNADSAPSGKLVAPVPGQIPSSTHTTFDGQGRTVDSALYSLGTKQWSTVTAYQGADETDVTPPAGGTPTATLTDGRGQTTELKQFDGQSPTGTYDKTLYTYDSSGNNVTKTGPLPSATDPDSTAGKAVTWSSSYDLLGNVVSSKDPDTGTTTTTYDDDGEVLTARDNAGKRSLTYDYDALGRKLHEYNGTSTDGSLLAAWTYDPSGALGQMASSTSYGASGKPEYTASILGYDVGYQPTKTVTTVPAGVYHNASPITYTSTNTYTPVQALPDTTRMATTGAGSLLPDETVHHGYNGTGLPTTLGGSDVYVAWTNYTPLGQVTRATMGNQPAQVVTTNNWEAATGRLLTATTNAENSTAAVDTVSYTYDASGRITSDSDAQDAAHTDTQCYTYDYLSRLTQAWTDTQGTNTAPSPSINGIGDCNSATPKASNIGGPTPYWQSYTYDVSGDRTAKTDHDPTGDTAKDVVTKEAYDSPGSTHAVSQVTVGQTTQNYTYDADGNPTAIATTNSANAQDNQDAKLAWTATGKLSTLTTDKTGTEQHATGYHYDADDNQVARTDDGTTTLYLGSDELTIGSDGTVTQATRYYAMAGAPTAVRTATAGKSTSTLGYLVSDPQGTATIDIDAATLAVTRRAYTPFGEARAGDAAGPWPGDKGFVGGTQDTTTGLTNLGAREYDPALGRFLSPDPLLVNDDPQQWNGYAYADNNPVDNADPSGLRTADCVGGWDECGPVSSHRGALVDDPGRHQSPGDADNIKAGVETSGTDENNDGKIKLLKHYSINSKWKYAKEFARQFIREGIKNCYIGDLSCYGVDNQADRENFASLKWNTCIGLGKKSDCFRQANSSLSEFTAALIGVAFGEGISGGKKGPKGSSGPCSFTPSTPVLMQDGKTKKIGDIQTGDEVEAADPDTGRHKGPEEVTATHINHDYDLVDLTIQTSPGHTAVLHTTSKHPFWDDSTHTWVPAGRLKPGQALITAANKHVRVARVVTIAGDADMYNLTVNQLHTYYVLAGQTPVLVHNSNGCVNWASNSVKTWGHTFKTHGAGAKNTKALTDRARSTGNQQGQWLDNDAAADFLKGLHVEGAGPRSVQIPEGMGQVIMPDGSIVQARAATVVPSPNGLYKTGFPIIGPN